MNNFKEISQFLIEGDVTKVKELVQKAIEKGENPEDILNEGLLAGMSVIGDGMRNGELFVPEVLLGARAMKEGMDLLRPLLLKKNYKGRGTIILGTVKGDLHDIGKNIVALMFESGGFNVIDLGIDVPSEKFVEATKEKDVKIVALSTLLTVTMPAMKEVIELLTKNNVRNKVKVMIGGAPITQQYSDEIGADGFASNAASAVEVALELVK